MRIVIGNDHRGVDSKNKLVDYLTKLGHEVENFGTDTTDSVDYPVYAFKVGKSLKDHDCDLGILICGTGIGMSIAANKVKGVRCAKVDSAKDARLSRLHNDANCVAFSSDMPLFRMKDIVDNFINTTFSDAERHMHRVEEINKFKG